MEPRRNAGRSNCRCRVKVLVTIHATAVNRADLLQRRGGYDPPPGASPYLGLEMAGAVAEVGPRAQGFAVGDRVYSILPGGGYAEAVAADPGYLMPLPEALSFTEGGGLPEVFLTAYVNLFMEAGLAAGETVLIHGGTSGVGTAAIQLARRAGATVCVTARSEAKLEACRKLGAQVTANEVVLVNAHHIKTVPGRKTDVQDCQWIAQLLQHGLLRASFIPPRPIRELRDLTRQRRSLVGERSSAVKRIHKVLEDCNIKLSSVATDVMGASGRDMIQALIDGEQDPLKLALLARGRLKAKRESLRQALHGHVTAHHRFMLRVHWAHIESLDRLIADVDQQIEEQVRPFAEIVSLLDQVPGIGETAAKSLIAEIGVDMDQFPDQHHLASWAGMSPGNNESAGKRKSGTTAKGNRWLRATLGEVAVAAARTKRSYLSARYRRLAARRGHNRSVVAVGHKILTIVYFHYQDRVTYDDLGEDYYDAGARSNSSATISSVCNDLVTASRSPKCQPGLKSFSDQASVPFEWILSEAIRGPLTTRMFLASCPEGEATDTMARDWESTFRSWAQPPGKTEQQRSENAINAIRQAIDGSPTLRARRIKVLPQGSYRNRVHGSPDSDVDVGVMLHDYSWRRAKPRAKHADFGNSDADYPFSQFKRELAGPRRTSAATPSRVGTRHFYPENSYESRPTWPRSSSSDGRPGKRPIEQVWLLYRQRVPNRELPRAPPGLLAVDAAPLRERCGEEQRNRAVFQGYRDPQEAPHRDGRSRPQHGEVGSRLSAGVFELERPQRCVQALHMGCVQAGLSFWSNTKEDTQCKSWFEVDNIKYYSFIAHVGTRPSPMISSM